VDIRGIPHLAKHERDVGHPALVARIEHQGSAAHVLQFGAGEGDYVVATVYVEHFSTYSRRQIACSITR
jgi:hypothetical protein